jgi:hypothetical protein
VCFSILSMETMTHELGLTQLACATDQSALKDIREMLSVRVYVGR